MMMMARRLLLLLLPSLSLLLPDSLAAADCDDGEGFFETTSTAHHQLLSGRLQMRHFLSQQDDNQEPTITMELVYAGLVGWIGVGFDTARMVGSQAVIGLVVPNNNNQNLVQVYNLGSYSPYDITPDAQATTSLLLEDDDRASLVQDLEEQTTTLTFTQRLTDNYQVGQEVDLIFAVGETTSSGGNNNRTPRLAYHQGGNRGTTRITLQAGTDCGSNNSNTLGNNNQQQQQPNAMDRNNNDNNSEKPNNDQQQQQPNAADRNNNNGADDAASCSFAPPVSLTGNNKEEDDETTASLCGFASTGNRLLRGRLLLRHYLSPDESTVTFQLEFNGQGWIGVGFGTSMLNTQAVIGIPDGNNNNGGGSVDVYNLAGYNVNQITAANRWFGGPFDVTDASIVQDDDDDGDGTTILTFTRPVTDRDGRVRARAGQPTDLIVAVGRSNELGYHAQRATVRINMERCLVSSKKDDIDTNAAADSTGSYATTALLQDNLMMHHFLNPTTGTLSVQMIYNGRGWIGFGFSPTGDMVETTAVIGSPFLARRDGESDGVALYDLNGKLPFQVQPSQSEAQLQAAGLTNASIVQNDSQTILTFTMSVDNSVVAHGQTARIIYAVGLRNRPGFHVARGWQDVVFADCQ